MLDHRKKDRMDTDPFFGSILQTLEPISALITIAIICGIGYGTYTLVKSVIAPLLNTLTLLIGTL